MVFPSYVLANVVDSELVMERGWREMAPTCPRCGSSNTKFCYYNNYSLTQPRYFCKGCRRYWTKGGSLRNVPVGGGCRKSRRSRSSNLRLAPSSNHRGKTSRSSIMFSSHNHHHHHHQGQLGGHSSYENLNNSMADSTTSPMNSSEAPTVDLAVVYANFLTQKTENSNDVLPSGGYNNPPLVELSSIPDATTIAPTSQVALQVQQEIPTFSQPLPIIMPELIMNNHHDNIDHQNQVLFVTDFRRAVHHQHDDHDDIHDGLELPPLPGDSLLLQDQHHHHQSVPWESSTLNDHHHQRHHHHHHSHHDGNDLEGPIRLQDLESDTQFSNLFNNGSWSPLDLPGFESSSSSSKT